MGKEFNKEYFTHLSKEIKDFDIIDYLIMENLGNNLNILDLGCGTGELALRISKKKYTNSCIGFDISKFACQNI